MQAREAFARLVALPDRKIPLAETALWIAAEARPGLDVSRYLAQLDALAERAGEQVARASNDHERVARLNHSLFVDEGFAGNHDEYEDPRNSFLDAVLDRRTGLPITLSLVYVEVARRIGLEAEGIGFPAHFLAKVSSNDGDVIVDAFHGETLSLEDCKRRLEEISSGRVPFEPDMLAASSHRAILRRVLTNLKHLYARRREPENTLACCDRLLLIAPDDPIEWRDRGLVYRELECFGAALSDLNRYLETAQKGPVLERIRRVVDELEGRARQIH
jgi:regulator of sirC expression with transglutaminase-like and TPR domain